MISKKMQVLQCLSPNRAKPQEWITCTKEIELLLSDVAGGFIHRLQGIPVNQKAARQEQAVKVRGGSVLSSLGQAGRFHGRALVCAAAKCYFAFIFTNESRLTITSKLLVRVAQMKEFLNSCLCIFHKSWIYFVFLRTVVCFVV